MLRSAALIILLAAGPAAATQEYMLPTLFDVQGVAAHDVLNIRQEPDASAPIIGTLAPDATRIEVVNETSGWGRINHGEVSGWVSMRYLGYRTDVWEPGQVPPGFTCLGTEPFWSLSAQAGEVRLSGPDMPEIARPVQSVLDSGIFRDPLRVILAKDLTAVATPQICSDGMSDRLYGLRASVILHGQGSRLLTGCCWIQR
jgi:uncharacterized membrane protein